MKVRVTEIGPNGLHIEDTLDGKLLNARFAESKGNGIAFDPDPQVGVLVTRIRNGVAVKGMLKARSSQPCARCLESISLEHDLSVDLLFHESSDNSIPAKPVKSAKASIADLEEDSVGIRYYSEDEIDLEDALQELLILRSSPYYRCSDNCKGLCPQCGANLNQTLCGCAPEMTTMGDLLAKAQKKIYKH